MGYRLIWSPRAASQLEGICEYIARDSRQYAAIFAQQVLQLVRALPSFPKAGRIVPEYNNPQLREKIHGNYRLVYRVKEQASLIEIVAICHSARLIQDAMAERD
jgi:toxin ParE1/3/4